MQALTVVWKSYLVLWIAFRGFTLGTRLLFGAGLETALFFFLGLVGFIPLVAFVVEKPLLGPWIWRGWLVLLVGWAVFDRTFYSAWFMQEPFDGQVVGLILAIPAFAATYAYSRSQFAAWS